MYTANEIAMSCLQKSIEQTADVCPFCTKFYLMLQI